MRMISSSHVLFLTAAALCGCCAGTAFCAAAEDTGWEVPKASVRVDVKVDGLPDHRDLGILVKIPDGRQLPGKYPVPEVRDQNNKVLESVIVGYDPSDALGVLFAQPEAGDVAHIYITGSATPPPKPANCKLFPSVIFYAKNGNASLDTAKRMANEYPPALGAAFGPWTCIGSMVNPYGPNDDFSSWYVGAILLKKRENIYFATVSDKGSEFWIDGKMVHSWPGAHSRDGGAKGQHGASVNLAEGLHRIDYYHYFTNPGKAESQLTCRRPGVPTKSGLPELFTDFAKSGSASISCIRFKDGRMGGCIRGNTQPNGYFWTGDQPLNLFTLSYAGISADADVSATWEFDHDRRITDSTVEWLVSGDADRISYPVTLAVSNKAGIARTSARLVCPWTPTELSLDNKGDRLSFRKALYNMVRSVPKNANPCAAWIPDDWEMLVELLEPYRGGPILTEIFNRGFDSIQKIPTDLRWALEDRFIETLRLQRNDKLLLDWIAKFESSEKNGPRRFRWKAERVEALLFDINDPSAAKREVAFLREAALAPDQVQIAALRQGDVERILGNTDAAMKFYKDSHERYRSRNKVGTAGGRLTYVGPRKRKPAADSTNEVDKAVLRKPKLQSLASQQKADDWKVYIVHDASMFTTIVSDLNQDALPEAFQKLADWENESPQSKFSGEYPLAAAKVYMYVEDYRRAANILSNFRKSVTMNAQLADAMKLETECLLKINEKSRAKEVATDFLKRFPGHPYETDMKEVLAL